MVTKKKLIQNTIKGKPSQRVPFSFWTHLPHVDMDPVKLAEATYDFYKIYDLDFIKTMNNGMYAIEDFGVEIDSSQVCTGGVSKLTSTPINSPDDWDNFSSYHQGWTAFERELKSVKLLKDKVGSDVPVIFTIFSPLTTINKLSQSKVYTHINQGKSQAIKNALDYITKQTIDLINQLAEIGVDGIFFASQESSYKKTDRKTYLEYGKPYDLKIIQAANKKMWFNVIHAHGEEIMFDVLRDYPVQVFNWHAYESYPTIDMALVGLDKPIMGGIDRRSITAGDYSSISFQIYNTLKNTQKHNLILTPGCGIRYPIQEDVLKYIIDELNFYQSKL